MPILVTLSGIVTLVKPVQPENSSSPMLVTLSESVMLVKPVQPQNARLSLKADSKKHLQPWRVLVFDTSGNDLIQSKRKTYEFLQGSDIPSRPYA